MEVLVGETGANSKLGLMERNAVIAYRRDRRLPTAAASTAVLARRPGESRDPPVSISIAGQWVPAFARTTNHVNARACCISAPHAQACATAGNLIYCGGNGICHCEKRSDEAIPVGRAPSAGDCFAPLAMTATSVSLW